MTYIISEPCIDVKDRSCVEVCPVDCIHEGDRMLVIDPEECIDCGACEPECPVEAISPEDAVPDEWEPFIRINYAFADGMETRQRARAGARRPERAATDRRPQGRASVACVPAIRGRPILVACGKWKHVSPGTWEGVVILEFLRFARRQCKRSR